MIQYRVKYGAKSMSIAIRPLLGLCVMLLSIGLSACGGMTISVGPADNSGGNNGGSAGNFGGNTSGGNTNYGIQSKTSGCRASGALPDSACTPGAIISTATVAQICQSGYSSTVRNVSTSTKGQVYLEYGIRGHQTGEYEVDHLIGLELGGSNDISNLWPEAASPKPGFHEKDQVENYLHAQVCSNAMSLAAVQKLIATNWLAAYQQMQGH